MSDGHSHEGSAAILAALGANIGIALTKALAWMLTGSSSMLAEAVHSMADSGNQVLLLVGKKRSQRQADDEHQFGYGRARYVAAFIVSIVLFVLGGLFALYESWEKFHHPEAITSWQWVPLAVLGVSIALESFSLHTALKEAAQARGNSSLFTYIRTSRSPEVPLLLLEDMGALFGLILAMGGVVMTLVSADGRWDALGSGAIGVLLVIIALFLATEMSSLLLGESATPEVQRDLESAIEGDGLQRLIYMKTVHTGPQTIVVAAKIAVDRQSTGETIARAINRAEERMRQAVPQFNLVIFIEPDLDHDGVEASHLVSK
ncbi:cation diffusion facilitator family transporter [Actinomyces vulturis]|uniref:cation diffusion facilitator family transporter n=1 Tax=Actinomyces vulturis TaxID=1857645 RepID=UPI0008366F6E|nr:cation diffusion facilitator family transporter [Actinomyces vulturis]